jgi:hypothetical protein
MTVSITNINTSTPNSGTGDTIYAAFTKSNANTGNLAVAVGQLQATYANTSYGVFANISVSNRVIGRMDFYSTNGGGVYVDGSPVATSAASFTGGNVPAQANFTATTSSSSTTTGAVTILGGLGVNQSIYVGGQLNVASTVTLQGNVIVGGPLDSSAPTVGALTVAGGLGVAKNVQLAQGLYVAGSSIISGTLGLGSTSASHTISSTTASTNTTTGALVVQGGIGIVGGLNVGGQTNLTDLNLSGNIVVSGNAILGSQTVSITDNLIELHTYANLAPLTADDGKDIGIRFHYYRAGGLGDKEAVLTFAHDTNAMEFYTIATESLAGQITGTYGTYKGGALIAANTTAATSTSTGALQVAGGAGIAGAVYAGSVYDNGNRVVTGITPTAGTGISITSATTTGPSASWTVGLATSGPGAGTTGSSTAIPVVTADAYGRISSITTAAVVAPAGTLSGATLNSGVTASSLTSVGTLTSLTVSGDIKPTSNVSVNLGDSTHWFNNIWGTAVHANYADLAENYTSDAVYEPGTVVIFGGDEEITTTNIFADVRVAGAISTEPAYLMNSMMEGQALALRGRIPLKVIGPVRKGDLLVTAGQNPGYATSIGHSTEYPLAVFAKAIETNTEEGKKVITAVII